MTITVPYDPTVPFRVSGGRRAICNEGDFRPMGLLCDVYIFQGLFFN